MAFNEEILKKLYCDLDNRESRWDEACEVCELPTFLHIGEIRCIKMSVSEIDGAWKMFRKIMKPIINWYKAEIEKMQIDSNFTQELKDHERKCELCEKQYTSIKELKEHEKEYHEQKCNRCE